jgi:hypothetical protein
MVDSFLPPAADMPRIRLCATVGLRFPATFRVQRAGSVPALSAFGRRKTDAAQEILESSI